MSFAQRKVRRDRQGVPALEYVGLSRVPETSSRLNFPKRPVGDEETGPLRISRKAGFGKRCRSTERQRWRVPARPAGKRLTLAPVG